MKPNTAHDKKALTFMNAYSMGKSGADKAFIEIFKRMKGKKITVVTSKLGKKLCQQNKLKAGYFLTSFENEFNHVILTYLQRICRALIFVMRFPRCAIVYSTSDSLPDILPASIYKLRNQKSLFVAKIYHLIPQERKISNLAQRISFVLINAFANVVIVDNIELKEVLVKKGFSEKRLHLNYPGIDHHYFDTILPSPTKYDAVFMGRLHKSKGIDDLVKIWENVNKKLPHVKLAIIGSGMLQNTSEVSKTIDFLGYLEDEEAFPLIKSSKVFIYPSNEEGFGMVIGEVMACGIPVVAYDLPVYKKTFKRAIKVVPLQRIDLFSNAVLQLLSNDKKRIRMASKGYSIIKDFTWDLTVKKELQIINS